MKKLFFGLIFAMFASQAQSTNIVPANLIVSHGGFDWVWASPCSADCSPLVNPAAGGTDWMFPSAFPVLAQPNLDIGVADPTYFNTNTLWPHWNLFMGLAQPFTQANGKCAAHIFDANFNHCDLIDGQGGKIAPDGVNVGFVWETWLVRRSVAVSEPATLALFGLGLIGLGFARRKRVA